jgi:hypothetical protein
MRALDALPRLAELALRVAREAGSLTLSIVRHVADPIINRGDAGDPPPPPSAPRREAATPPGRAHPIPEPAVRATPQPPAPEPPPPDHVDREAVVVAEFADAGAEDGAGAQISVDEPWDGYGQLGARDIVAQLATADAATLAVVRLYEASHRGRRTVLAETDRQLATADR